LSAFIDGSVDRLSQRLDDEIFSKLSSPSTQSTQSQSKSNASQQQKERPVEGRPDPLRIGDPRQPFLGYSPFYEEQRFPPPIGGADLGLFTLNSSFC
jgi:hypothetical protein